MNHPQVTIPIATSAGPLPEIRATSAAVTVMPVTRERLEVEIQRLTARLAEAERENTALKDWQGKARQEHGNDMVERAKFVEQLAARDALVAQLQAENFQLRGSPIAVISTSGTGTDAARQHGQGGEIAP